MAAHHSPADQQLINALSTGVLRDFREYMFNKAYISANPGIFLDTAWISMPALRAFLEARDRDTITISSSPASSPIKLEADALRDLTVKAEPSSSFLPIRIRSHTVDNREIIELLSDSDEDAQGSQNGTAEKSGSSAEPPLRPDSLSAAPEASTPDEAPSEPSDEPVPDPSAVTRAGSLEPNLPCCAAESDGLRKSDTRWLDAGLSSRVRTVKESFTSDSRTYVEDMEYLTEIPSLLPVPRVPVAYVFDLSDPKFDAVDKHGHLIPLDTLVKQKLNDSFHGNSGSGDSHVMVTFAPGEDILCRRSRNDCQGCHACSAVDEALLKVVRYDLDPKSRDAVFAAQRETRRNEGGTAERRAAAVKSTPCRAMRSDGTRCTGGPKLMKKREGQSRGHQFWIACDGWTPAFKEAHRTHSIPDNVDENELIKCFANEPFAGDDSADTQPCSRIVHPHIGGKLKFCRHPHIINGNAVAQCRIQHHKCPCKLSIYVPIDTRVRKVLLFHPKSVPHNHPIPPLLKLSHEARSKYTEAVAAAGIVGSTIAKVDNGKFITTLTVARADYFATAASTRIVFGGLTPAQSAPALQGKRIKRDIIREGKKRLYPAGMGIPGAYQLYLEDRAKPANERYIHRFHNTADGGLIIFTCFAPLLTILDDTGVKSFEDDTTFKRIEGDINEWEVVTYYNAVERAVTLARAYINRGDTKFFELLFDMFREIKLELTGRDIAFARFMEDGNLLTNVPSFSGITTIDPHVFATFFIKFCATHAKRPLPDFKSLISAKDYLCLKDFMYIKSVADLRSFSQFISDLSVKKMQDWWAHKEMGDWIIPCLVKSQSNIRPEDWDSTPATTNTGEAQHHWTNSLTGIKLTLVEGIERHVVKEIDISKESGVLLNSSNEMFHRLGRSSQRQSHAAKKSRESTQASERVAELRATIEAKKAEVKASEAELKSLRGASSRSTNTESRKKSDTLIVSSSSCGRVKTVTVPRQTTSDFPEPLRVAPASSVIVTAAQEIQVMPAAAATIPDYVNPLPAFDSGDLNLPEFDFDPALFDSHSDSTFLGAGYDFNFDPSLFGFDSTPLFSAEALGASMSQSDSEWATLMAEIYSVPAHNAPAAWDTGSEVFNWSAHSPQELPILPRPPASSPPDAASERDPIDDRDSPERAPQDVDLEANGGVQSQLVPPTPRPPRPEKNPDRDPALVQYNVPRFSRSTAHVPWMSGSGAGNAMHVPPDFWSAAVLF
ncbi:hypothetical protein B0H10DRAFT_1964097 [Mycena sp. CBHHK59/15]|nr:hypothetical protein B0H10DRAFT_1964097 [Mycena sp. CBHHK59/15]